MQPQGHGTDVRLAELVAALSLAIDLGMGQPMQHGLRSRLLAVHLGEEQIAAIPGIRLEAGDPRAWEHGSVGWAADRPRFVLPDGSVIQGRVTAVALREDGEWRLVQAHFSVGVADEEAIEAAKESSAQMSTLPGASEMEAASSAQVMRQYAEAWTRNDWDAALAFQADDIVHHVPGRHRLAGDFVGKQAFLDHYGNVFAELGGTFRSRRGPRRTGQRPACGRPGARAGGARARSLEFNRVVVYYLCGGKIVETWSHDYDPYALDDFWAERGL